MKSFVFLLMLGLAAVVPMGCDADKSVPTAPKTGFGVAWAATPPADPASDPPFMPVPPSAPAPASVPR